MRSMDRYVKCIVNFELYLVFWIVIVSINALDMSAGTVGGVGTVAPLLTDTPVGSDKILEKDFKKFDNDPPPEYYK